VINATVRRRRALRNCAVTLMGSLAEPAVVPLVREDSWQRGLNFAYTDYH